MSLPRMSWHIGDYKKDTGHLRAAGHGAYFMLCMHYWASGGLPNDDKQLATIACMTDREWKAHKKILKALFKGEGGPWKHKRVEEELADAQEKYEKLSKAGRDGNAKRWGSPGDRHPIRDAIPMPSQPITDNREREEGGGGDARARTPLISPDSLLIATEVAELCGYADPKQWPPGWCGAPLKVQAWLNEGWPREIILATCREAMGKKRDGPPDKINYFQKAIARAVAQHAAPLPKVVIQNTPEVIHAQANSHAAGTSYGASKDRFRAAHAKLKAHNAAERAAREGEGGGGEVVRPVAAD